MIDSPTKNNRVGMIAGALTLLLFGILILSSPLAQAVGALNIVIYDPTGPQVSTTPVLPTSTAPGVTAPSLAQVGTIGAWGNNNAWPVGQIGVSTLTDRTRYVKFTVTPGTRMQYTSLSYSKQSYLGEGPRNAAIRTSLDGFTADVDSIAGLDPGGIEQLQFDLTSLTPTASPLEFRVYFFNTPSTGLDWADLLSTGAGFTGLILKGDAVAVGGTTSFLNNGDGLSSGSIAIIAGGIAAVVAIVAGGWYTRRRWLGSRS